MRNGSNHSQQIINKAKSYAHVLRDDGLSYLAYTEQITFLLFLKMLHERTQPPYNERSPIPPDEDGNEYIPSEGTNDIGDLVPGNAYAVYVVTDTTLVYPNP